MNLTFDTIKQLINEEISSLLQESAEQKLLKLISDGEWATAMNLASTLGMLEDEGFANGVINAIVDGLKKEAKTINFGRDNVFIAERDGMGVKMYVQNIENGMTGMESSLKIEPDGSLSLDSFAAPEVGKGLGFFTLNPKKYSAQNLNLAEALEKINIIYSFGWETRKK
jgi:hypothetical protein